MDKLDKPLLLLKLGTATLTKGGARISRAKLEDIAAQVVEIRADYEVVLVCSGAIAAAKQFTKLEKFGDGITEKQALAAVGQPFLMRLIYESFRDFGLPVGQCLLSYPDFHNPTSRENIRNTIHELLKNDVLPIINENDTTATEELKFGDNDKLSALTSCLLSARMLVIASNTFGIYDAAGNTVTQIENPESVRHLIRDEKSAQGTGGMHSKLDAVAIARAADIECRIVNGHEDNFLLRVLKEETAYSRFTKK